MPGIKARREARATAQTAGTPSKEPGLDPGPTIPDPNNPVSIEQKRRQLQERAFNGGGRLSTILSDLLKNRAS
tara:strand:+ start:3024 stop:3242 length:219 start_codon:yes stop_codon:yes gene_type:complete